nr:hypothetical protein Iba_chr13eCG10340 [Ipomoea batatas]
MWRYVGMTHDCLIDISLYLELSLLGATLYKVSLLIDLQVSKCLGTLCAGAWVAMLSAIASNTSVTDSAVRTGAQQGCVLLLRNRVWLIDHKEFMNRVPRKALRLRLFAFTADGHGTMLSLVALRGTRYVAFEYAWQVSFISPVMSLATVQEGGMLSRLHGIEIQ